MVFEVSNPGNAKTKDARISIDLGAATAIEYETVGPSPVDVTESAPGTSIINIGIKEVRPHENIYIYVRTNIPIFKKISISSNSINGAKDFTYSEYLEKQKCGNRRLEDTEQCDDGNMGAGDGCSATCQYEVVNEVEPNATSATATSMGNPDKLTRGAFMPAADEDFWKFHIDARSDVLIETFDEMGPGKCATMDTVIELRAMDGTTIITSDDDGGVGACSLIDPGTNTLARGLARGDYYVRVRLYSTTSTATAYHLRVRVVAQCGNNVRESTEMCDDGNTTDGDGCQSSCTLPSVLESEPNDDGAVSMGGGSTTGNDFSSAMAGTPITADRLIDAKIMPVGDEDVFAIRNTTGAARSVTVTTLGPSQCGSMDTYLHIRDMAGASLASDDDSADGNCSKVTYSVPAMTTVFAHVFEYGDDAVIAAYQVYIQFN